MVEMKSDELSIEQEGNKFIVTRVVVEEYEPNEILETIGRLNRTVDAIKNQVKATTDQVNVFKKFEKLAEKVNEKELKKIIAEREKDAKKTS